MCNTYEQFKFWVFVWARSRFHAVELARIYSDTWKKKTLPRDSSLSFPTKQIVRNNWTAILTFKLITVITLHLDATWSIENTHNVYCIYTRPKSVPQFLINECSTFLQDIFSCMSHIWMTRSTYIREWQINSFPWPHCYNTVDLQGLV